MKYTPYWKSSFEKCWKSLLNNNVISGWSIITDELREVCDHPINEIIYRLDIGINNTSIIVYSSVDVRTERTRQSGKDAVRIIFEWNTKNGLIYAHIDKRLRVEGLFENISDSIVQAKHNAKDNLKAYRFSNLEDALT